MVCATYPHNINWSYAACFVPVIYIFYPETKGLELEDVDRLFAKGEETNAALKGRKISVDEEESVGAPNGKL